MSKIKRKIKISVVVCTRSRPNFFFTCLKSILRNPFINFEIIIVDQADDDKNRDILQKILNSPQIRYYRMKEKGHTKGRNLGIKKAKGAIIAFVDDDCLISKDWLKTIYSNFEINDKIVTVLGRVLPLHPKKHKGLYCPSVLRRTKKLLLTKLPVKKEDLLLPGNNMAFRREVFDKVGLFKEWLGVGSVGIATDEEEMIYRILKSGLAIFYNPKIKVFHDRWLAPKEYNNLYRKYSCGFFAAFGYHAFRKEEMAKNYLIFFLKNKMQEWTKEIKFCLQGFHLKSLFWLLLRDIPLELFYCLRGLAIAFYSSLAENFRL